MHCGNSIVTVFGFRHGSDEGNETACCETSEEIRYEICADNQGNDKCKCDQNNEIYENHEETNGEIRFNR